MHVTEIQGTLVRNLVCSIFTVMFVCTFVLVTDKSLDKKFVSDIQGSYFIQHTLLVCAAVLLHMWVDDYRCGIFVQ